MLFSKKVYIIFCIGIIVGNIVQTSEKKSSVPKDYLLYPLEEDKKKGIQVSENFINYFHTLINMLQDLGSESGKEIGIDCSSEILQKINDLYQYFHDTVVMNYKIKAMSLSELVDFINCFQKLDLKTDIKKVFLKALVDDILRLIKQFNQYILHQHLPLPDYEPLRKLSSDVYTDLKKLKDEEELDILDSFWKSIKDVLFVIGGEDTDEYLQVLKNKKTIVEIFDDIASKISKSPKKEENVPKKRHFNYKKIAAAIFAIIMGKILWDAYRNKDVIFGSNK